MQDFKKIEQTASVLDVSINKILELNADYFKQFSTNR